MHKATCNIFTKSALLSLADVTSYNKTHSIISLTLSKCPPHVWSGHYNLFHFFSSHSSTKI